MSSTCKPPLGPLNHQIEAGDLRQIRTRGELENKNVVKASVSVEPANNKEAAVVDDGGVIPPRGRISPTSLARFPLECDCSIPHPWSSQFRFIAR